MLIRYIIVAIAWHWTFAQIVLAQAPQPAEWVTYTCQHRSVDDVARLLKPLLPQSEGVQVVVDTDSNRLLVTGPEVAHTITRRVMSEVDRPKAVGPPGFPPAASEVSPAALVLPPNASGMSQPVAAPVAAPLEARGTPLPSGSTPSNTAVLPSTPGRMPPAGSGESAGFPAANGPAAIGRFLYVPADKLPRVEQQMGAIFSERLHVHRAAGREMLLLDVPGPQGTVQQLQIEFDRLRSGMLVAGPEPAVSQLLILAQALASENTTQGTRTQVFRVQRKNQPSVRRMLQPSRPATSSPSPDSYGGNQRRVFRDEQVIQASFQEPTQINPPGLLNAQGLPEEQNQVSNVADGPALDATARQFEGVEIESLPDLDVIILKGRDQDLDQLSEIIQQLERLSLETQPEVQVYNLQHAQSESVARIITQTSKDLVGGRQGRASVTPLIKPNALLIIGWGDAVKSIVQLIQQLDTPVAADTQFQVFNLQHGSAQAVQGTITSFFANRAGLGPEVRVTIDQRTNSLIVSAAPRDMLEVQRLVMDLDRAESGSVNRAQVFAVENALATDIAVTLQQAIRSAAGDPTHSSVLELQTLDAQGQKLLRSGTLDRVQITPNPRNNTLIVSSPQENLELIAELIRQLDTPAIQVQIKVFRIVNGDAANLTQTLRSLIPSQPGSAADLQVPNSPDNSSLAPLRFSVDVRSNSIIATGSEGDLRIVEALLVKLDQSTSLQRKTVVYQLKNSPAVDVASAVNQFLVNRRQIDLATPGADNPYQSIEREVVVIPEPVANKLILSTTSRYFEEMNELIERLDEQPPQVVIQVLIAEVTLNNADEFGVELGLQDSVLFDRSLLGDLAKTTQSQQTSTAAGVVTTTQELIQAATNTPGFNFNSTSPLGNSGSDTSRNTADTIGSQGISNFAVGRGNEQLGFGGLVLSASSQNVNLLLRALQETRRAEILSRPQIRTLDNQPAFIQVGQRVPRIVGSTVNQNGQSNSVSLENVGLILGVTPRISPDGMVVMEIDAEKSAVGLESEGIPVAVSVDGTVIRSPRVDTATAQATVSAASGETIVLGGLITTSDQEIHRQVPFLGDIPLLGALFRFDSQIARRTELLIILTPHVIRTAADSERLKQAEMARMSWCAADVTAIHDGLSQIAEPNLEVLDAGSPDVIFPDLNPRGEQTDTRSPAAPSSSETLPPLNLTFPEQ